MELQANLDLSEYHFKRPVLMGGILSAYGTWWHDEGKHEPCLVILRAGEEGSPYTVPCVVLLKDAWKWSEEAGMPGYGHKWATRFAATLRFNENDLKTVFGVLSIVRDQLGDLISIPPYRRLKDLDPVSADVTIRDRDSNRSKEIEIRGTDV